MDATLRSVALSPGEIQLFDNYLPALSAGSYTLTVAPSLSDPNGVTPIPTFTPATQILVAGGPHYTLDPTLIFAMQPPPNASGDYGQYLPQIVLSHPTLPWLRLIDSSQQPTTPWLALLLFHPDEIGGTSPDASATFAQSGQVGAVLDKSQFPTGYAQPSVGLDTNVDPTSSCQYVDLPASLFLQIAPKLAELPYLAHFRQIDTVANDGSDLSGSYAAVIGNRLPSAGPNVVHLVSLEGYVAYLPGASSPLTLDTFDTIRLVSLASWVFDIPTDGGPQFPAYMTHLSRGMLQLPVPSVTQPTPAQATLLTAMADGYVPVTYALREGEQTAGWCRGPLSPFAVTPAPPGRTPLATSDAALVYDQLTGMFDLSYAIAWQIGRLLALTDTAFCAALLALRAQVSATVVQTDLRDDLAARFAATLALPQSPAERLAPRAASRACREFLFGRLPGLLTHELAPLLATRRDRRGLQDRLDRLPGVLPQAELIALIADGGDPLVALLRRLLPGRLPAASGDTAAED
jgi:hypothetical protein